VIEASKPALTENGLTISQFPCSDESGVGIETILLHTSGEWISCRYTMPLGEEKGKSLAQVAGSIITYLRRYAWASVLGMYADDDTDGNNAQSAQREPPRDFQEPDPVAPGQKRERGAGKRNSVTPQQAKFLFVLFTKKFPPGVGDDHRHTALQKAGVEKLEHLPYDTGKALIDKLVAMPDYEAPAQYDGPDDEFDEETQF